MLKESESERATAESNLIHANNLVRLYYEEKNKTKAKLDEAKQVMVRIASRKKQLILKADSSTEFEYVCCSTD
jgi:hypothetical protein